MIFSVLDVLKHDLQALFGHQKQQSLPRSNIVYSNTEIAPNMQRSWLMRFKMEFLIPYPLDSNSIWHSI
jgi:hypothetical protein